MKTLETQQWLIKDETEDEKNIIANFEYYTSGTKLVLLQGEKSITFTKETLDDLKSILESTKFIFKQ